MILIFLTDIVPATTLLNVILKGYTRGPLFDKRTLSSEISDFIYNSESQPFLISLEYCLLTFILTSLTFHS
jgi:hypothetical protein